MYQSKEVNLISLIATYSNVSSPTFTEYLNYNSINLKKDELEDIKTFVNVLNSLTKNVTVFDAYFAGYIIPQIVKEFDLLRFGEYVVNIEIKSIADQEKIKKQLLRNKYYLSFLNKEMYLFTFTSKTKKLFTLDENDNLIEISYEYLIEILENQNIDRIKDVNSLFNPSNYLVSPFNSTREFIQERYFLTVHQERIRSEVLEKLDDISYIILAIKGKAGTGKSLLTYDIAKKAMALGKKVLIVHCGKLNFGHSKLVSKYKWDIIPAKSISRTKLELYDLVIIDEAQRIYPVQLDRIINLIKKESGKCIFSYDGQQCLHSWEITNNIEEQIEQIVSQKPFELTTKIRSNKEIADFLNCFFDKKKPVETRQYPNVELNYFDNYVDAIGFINYKKLNNWKTINYTPSTKDTLPYEIHRIEKEIDNAHTVIGQEFDNVIAVIDEFFYYKNGKLSTRDYHTQPYYHPTKMLFQIASRTRIKLAVVIVNNEAVLQHCLSILNKSIS